MIGLAVVLYSCSKNATDKTVITEPEKPLNGTFKISSDNVFENEDVILTPEDTRVSNSYYWDFGMINNKRVTSTDKIPVMSFKMHGNYNVTLTITNGKGETATSTQFLPILCNWFGSGPHPQ